MVLCVTVHGPCVQQPARTNSTYLQKGISMATNTHTHTHTHAHTHTHTHTYTHTYTHTHARTHTHQPRKLDTTSTASTTERQIEHMYAEHSTKQNHTGQEYKKERNMYDTTASWKIQTQIRTHPFLCEVNLGDLKCVARFEGRRLCV